MPKSTNSKPIQLENKTVVQLKALCKKRGFEKCYLLRKADLIRLLSGDGVASKTITNIKTTPKTKATKTKKSSETDVVEWPPLKRVKSISKPNEIISLVKSVKFEEKASVDLSKYPKLVDRKKALFFDKKTLKKINHKNGALEFIQYKEPSIDKFLKLKYMYDHMRTYIFNITGKPYDYSDATEGGRLDIYQCYVNFADSKLFGYWYSPLFAQDEIQVAEHPDLARVAVELNYPNCWQKPCLISNAKRIFNIDASGVCGDAFMKKSFEEVKKSIEPIEPIKTNILAMAAIHVAPHLQGDKYSRKDIITLFKTAYTAFRMVVLEKKWKEHYDRLIINTGNWGTGAFGNNYMLIAVLQILAAKYAGIDELQYFTFDSTGDREFKKAEKWIDQNVSGNETIGELVDIIDNEQMFVYGLGNGT